MILERSTPSCCSWSATTSTRITHPIDSAAFAEPLVHLCWYLRTNVRLSFLKTWYRVNFLCTCARCHLGEHYRLKLSSDDASSSQFVSGFVSLRPVLKVVKWILTHLYKKHKPFIRMKGRSHNFCKLKHLLWTTTEGDSPSSSTVTYNAVIPATQHIFETQPVNVRVTTKVFTNSIPYCTYFIISTTWMCWLFRFYYEYRITEQYS